MNAAAFYKPLVCMLVVLLASCSPATELPEITDTIETPTEEVESTSLSETIGWNQAEGIEGPVYSLDWSPDGRRIASAGWGQVLIWDARSGQLQKVLSEPQAYTWSVAWSPDGRHLAAAGVDGVIRIWSLPDFSLEQSFGTRWVFSVDWSPDGERLAVGYQGGEIDVFDWRSGEVMAHMRAGSLVVSLDWSPDGQLIASGSLNGVVAVWEFPSGQELVRFDDYTTVRCDANGVAWSPDGQVLASAHQDGPVRLWDVSQGELLTELEGHISWARGLAWSPDGRYLASSGFDSKVNIWEWQSGEIVTTFESQAEPVWAVSWAPDQSAIVSGSGYYDTTDINGVLWVWEFNRP